MTHVLLAFAMPIIEPLEIAGKQLKTEYLV